MKTGIDESHDPKKYDAPVEATIDLDAEKRRAIFTREYTFFHESLFEPLDNMQVQCYSEAASNGWHDDDARDNDNRVDFSRLRRLAGTDADALSSIARLETMFASAYTDQIGVRLLNIISESVEAWEGFRGRKANALCDKSEKMIALGLSPLTNIEEELADIMIRAMDTAQVANVNLRRAISIKLLFNRSRGHKHGNKAR